MLRLRRVVLAAALLVPGGCQFDRHVTVRTEPVVSVHAVLNPAANEIYVLVEEILSGAVTVNERIVFDPSDPINTGVGVPVPGARVVIRSELGDSAVGYETFGPRGSTGVYRIDNLDDGAATSIVLEPGRRYDLVATTPGGERITGSTTIPAYPESPLIAPPVTIDRESDTLNLVWPLVPLAKRYLVRIESPHSPYHLFRSDTRAPIPGDLRNPWQLEVPPVFLPGFTQRIQVAAVDENFYDYYRSGNDPFSGRGLINHLTGGVGFFGSVVPLTTTQVHVVAPIDRPWEGDFDAAGDVGAAEARTMRLYEAGRADGVVVLSGTYERGDAILEVHQLVGTLVAGRFMLRLLDAPVLSDTTMVLRGRMAGDSLIVESGAPRPDTIVYLKR